MENLTELLYDANALKEELSKDSPFSISNKFIDVTPSPLKLEIEKFVTIFWYYA
jgi:hypothetical protein